jgi:4-deoxy-L-threo-5-hexosulose-uronate ketol-isomerase
MAFMSEWGIQSVKFRSTNPNHPGKYSISSTPAHQSYPVVKIENEIANPVRLGSEETSIKRTIYQYVHPAVCKSCQLVMGLYHLLNALIQVC